VDGQLEVEGYVAEVGEQALAFLDAVVVAVLVKVTGGELDCFVDFLGSIEALGRIEIRQW
jgi:hypothetical protein